MASLRYNSLDHWRGAACLAVLVTHSVWYRTGTAFELTLYDIAARLWIGVPVFFVVSGYCISAAADSHRRQTVRPLRTYFARRLRRIFPPYWAVLFGTVATVAVLEVVLPTAPLSTSGEFLRPWWYDTRQWLGNITLTEQWRYHVWPGQKGWILGHAWTLAYEEQFYIVVGLLIWAAPRRFFLGGLGVSAGVAGLALMARSAGWSIDGFFFDGSWLQFWFGMVLYYVLAYGTPWLRLGALALFAGAAVLSAWHPARILEAAKNTEQAFFVAAIFAGVALLAYRFDAAIVRSRWLRPLQMCGLMCYSLYLVHLPLVKLVHVGFIAAGSSPRPLVSLAVCLPLSLALAWSFHLTIERRFMNLPSPAGHPVKAGPAVARARSFDPA
jgi:peptidoglycan/LPS O-acetylase OafA/YrhL